MKAQLVPFETDKPDPFRRGCQDCRHASMGMCGSMEVARAHGKKKPGLLRATLNYGCRYWFPRIEDSIEVPNAKVTKDRPRWLTGYRVVQLIIVCYWARHYVRAWLAGQVPGP